MTEIQSENTSVWNEFNKLTHLSLDYSDSSASNRAIIYANNNNQVKIGIRVRAENQQGQHLNLTLADLRGKISLCDSITGKKIDESKWTLSEDDKGYATAVNYSGQYQHRAKKESDDSVYIERYLSSSSSNENGYRFSVAIDIPGIGEFSTSDNGTNTPNAPKGREGSPFKSPKSLLISTLPLISYSESSYRTTGDTKFSTINNKLTWTSRFGKQPPGVFKDHTTGTCQRKIFSIKPNIPGNEQVKFKEHNITYDGISNGAVNTGRIRWELFNTEDGFNLIEPGKGNGLPCAVIGRGAGRDDYQVNLWFLRQNKINIDGHFYTEDSIYVYRFRGYVMEDHFGDDEQGAVTLLLYKFTMPEDNTRQLNWSDVINIVTVDVTETYGNKGRFQVFFDDKDYFDIPKVI